MINALALQGRIPFDLEIKGEEGKEFLGFSVSYQTSFKPEGEKYYKEELLYCKAFKKTATFINQYFAKGSDIVIEGEVRRDDDYTDKDGNAQKGQMYVMIRNAHFAASRKATGGDTEDAPAVKAGAKAGAKTGGIGAKTGGVAAGTGTAAPKKKLPF